MPISTSRTTLTRFLSLIAIAIAALAIGASSAAAADTTPPVVTFWYPANNSYTNVNPVNFYYTVNEPNTRRCHKDSQNWSTYCPTMFGTSYSPDGAHSYTVEAKDTAGNVTTAVVNFTLDRVAPVITWSVPANGSYVNTNPVDHIYQVNESNTRRCHRDNESWSTSCPTMFGTSYSGDGAHSYTVEATDLAGNVSTLTANFTIDTVAPTITWSVPAAGAYVNTNPVDHIYQVSESNTRRCHRDNESWSTSCPTMFGTSYSGDGAHSYTVEATDLAGNVSTHVANFTIDTVSPTITMWYPAEGATVETNPVDFYYTVSESNTRRCKKDSGSWVTTCPTMFATSYTGNGPHSYTVEATDLAGNVSTLVRNFTLAVP